MPAVPVAPPRQHDLPVPVPQTQGIFERGDRIYLTTPVQLIKPSESEIEEFAFSKAVKQNAPNENLVWFRGSYVEAGRANENGAQWRSNELAIKSLTPMLMPVTVMHDPRTAVGTIADTKLLTPEKDGVTHTRIDTVLALWGHRFPDAVHEAEANAAGGTLMQSMECFTPWYECSECGRVFHKLPQGAEQSQWCDHLKASNPNAGFVDVAAQASNASRILGDVCFTGTGLIFGSRGARGAYTEAHLESWEDEVASFHTTVHTSTSRSERDMGLVQIEQSELDTLRKERDEARSEAQREKEAKAAAEQKAAEADTKVEQAEAKVTQAEEAKATAETKVTELEEAANTVQLRDERWGKLGDGFTAKLGETTKARLQEQAGTMPDDDWDKRLTEVEELTAVKRDTGKQDGGDKDEEARNQGAPTFSLEEIASSGLTPSGDASKAPSDDQRASVVGSLAGVFAKQGS